MDPQSQEIFAARNRGELDPIAAEIMVAQKGRFYESHKTTVRYVQDTLLLNTPLSPELFRIAIPETAGIRMPDKSVAKPDNKGILNIRFLAIAGVLVLFILLCGAALYYRRVPPRGKRGRR